MDDDCEDPHILYWRIEEEEVKSWDSCCVLWVTCALVISVTKLYSIGRMRDFEI